MLKKNSLTKK